MWYEIPQHIEVVNNEEVTNQNLQNLEEKAAEKILYALDKQTAFDIDVWIDRKKNCFYLIVNNNFLNIPMDIKKLWDLWQKIVTLLANDKEEKLTWMIGIRGIWEGFIWNFWTNIIIDNKNDDISQYQVEEIFRFLKMIQWKEITEDNVSSQICAGNKMTDECLRGYK